MNNKTGSGIKLLVLVIITWLLPASCNEEQVSKIPYREVDFPVPLANYIELNIPGNYIFFPNAGYAGIIVFCESVNPNIYSAYDAACTYDISRNCSLLQEGAIDGVIATCPCCNSQFSLFGGGYVINEGPAAQPLKRYRTQLLNGNRLRIYN